ncbi:MAG: cellulase N-terminal Ig-like domain-containing protein [Acidimicrobiales bacterium]
MIGAAFLALAVAAASVVGVREWRQRALPSPLRGPDQRTVPGLDVAPTPVPRGAIAIRADGLTVPGPDLTVDIDPPSGSTEMAIGFDPTFAAVGWQPVQRQAVLTAPAQGYQVVYARFRSGGDTVPSAVSVDGITLDATWEAATASASASGRHRASWVRPLSGSMMMVRIEAGRLERGVVQPYDFDDAPPGDDVQGAFPFLWDWEGVPRVIRDGRPFGRQVAGSDRLLRPYDRLVGRPLDADELLAGAWRITSPDDPAYGPEGAAPTGLAVTSRPSGSGTGPRGPLVVAMVHDVAVGLPRETVAGRHYRLEPPGDLVEPIEWTAGEAAEISPAVHVNQAGYAPDDGLKVAYLSGPLPSGLPAGADLDYRAGMGFRVIDAGTGAGVVSGTVTARPGGDELGRGDLTGTPVFELDLSALETPGRYQACVDGVGCSVAFDVRPSVWRDLTVTVARAMFHQRSGLALGPPYTSIVRPRPRHPDEGTVVEASSLTLSAAGRSADLFAELVAGRQKGQLMDGAWGGHFDAGDWDRRIEHLWYTRAAAELVDRRPGLFARLDLDLPESGDDVPDLLDEGLWSLDLYRRMQQPDGAIRGGIEASEHPQPDTTSWTDDLALLAYAPDAWSSYLYAGVAAEAAHVLARYDADRAQGYLESALAAMTWAEAQAVAGDEELAAAVAGQRSVAAAALLSATGDRRWHDVFLDATDLDSADPGPLACHEHTRCDAAWLYWTADPALTDPALRARIADAVVANAETLLTAQATVAFGWAVDDPGVPLIWGLGLGGAPHVTALVRAYEITGDERYRAGAERAAAASLGANPIDTALVTGVGTTPSRSPLIVDVANGGLPVWPGTPVYGMHQVDPAAEGWIDGYNLGPAGTRPRAADLPYAWQWFDASTIPQMDEFTVHQSHGAALYAFGMLARQP